MEPAMGNSSLMGLPLEIRTKILGYLLPNLSEIKVFDGYYDSFNPAGGYYPQWLELQAEKAITKRIASMVQYRDDGEQCHTAVLRVSHRLHIEGTTVTYSRAFRAVITARGLTFLKYRFTSLEWQYKWGEIHQGTSKLRCFPFHMAKQIQIEFWATQFEKQDDILYQALLSFCLALCNKPCLRNVRVDLYDRDYRPKPMIKNQDRMADTNGPYPPQDVFRGEILNEPFQRTEEEVEFWGGCKNDYYDLSAEPWQRAAGRELRFWQAQAREEKGLRRLTGLEEALEPLKLLANVGRAKINLTSGAENQPEMMADARKLEGSMMHKGLRHEMNL